MRAKLVRIGNSRGVRLPKPILEESGLPEDIEIKVEADRVVLMPARKHPREGWAESARRMVANRDDVDLWEGATGLNSWDEEEWEWPEDFRTTPSFRRISHRPRSRPRLRNPQNAPVRRRLARRDQRSRPDADRRSAHLTYPRALYLSGPLALWRTGRRPCHRPVAQRRPIAACPPARTAR